VNTNKKEEVRRIKRAKRPEKGRARLILLTSY
jgi:hypothetical protein